MKIESVSSIRNRIAVALCRHRLSGKGSRFNRLLDVIPTPALVACQTTFGSAMLLDPRDVVQGIIISDGVCEPLTLSLFRKLLNKNTHFLDVGAHVGHFTLFAASVGACVVALEPDPRTYSSLLRNISLNECRSVHSLPVAAGSEWRISRFLRPERGNWGMTRRSAEKKVGDEGFWAASVPTSKILLEIGIDRLDVAKIDVEGAELDVLMGLLKSGIYRPEHIVLEYLPDYFPQSVDALAYLKSLGYRVCDVNGRSFDEHAAPVEGNVWASLSDR